MNAGLSASRTMPAHHDLPQLVALSSWGQGPSMASGSGLLGQSHQLSYFSCPATGTHFLPWVSTLWYMDLLHVAYMPPKI